MMFKHRVEDAIASTVKWRDSFGIQSVDTAYISSLVGQGLGKYNKNRIAELFLDDKLGPKFSRATLLNHFISIQSLLSGYTSDTLDKEGRSIIYVKIGRNERMEETEIYQKLLMYTVERY